MLRRYLCIKTMLVIQPSLSSHSSIPPWIVVSCFTFTTSFCDIAEGQLLAVTQASHGMELSSAYTINLHDPDHQSVANWTPKDKVCYEPVAQISQCIGPEVHNALVCNRNVHTRAHFSYKMVHCGTFVWCSVGFGRYDYRRKISVVFEWVRSWLTVARGDCEGYKWDTVSGDSPA